MMLADYAGDLLSRSDEIELARCIEGGLIAQCVVDGRWCDPVEATADELGALTAAGRQAWRRMWLANVGLVRLLARREGRPLLAPLDDVMQEGFMGLADAIMRWDYARGTRFSTVAWHWIENRMRAYVRDYLRGAAGGHEMPEVADWRSPDVEVMRDVLPEWALTPDERLNAVLAGLARGDDVSARVLAERWGMSVSSARRVKLAALEQARQAWQDHGWAC